MTKWLIVQIIALLLAYVIPYSLLRESSGWGLYAFWALLGMVSLVSAWAGTRGWGRGG
ncbi:MAG: hypothetical protein F7B17_04540 [Desulfurococcales archaeon]|nr:hypothetical protein [Desulfurococcales archaeon]